MIRRFFFWLASFLLFFAAATSAFDLIHDQLIDALVGGAGGLSLMYLLIVTEKSVNKKLEALKTEIAALAPMTKPDYQPTLFGVPMEWDDEIGFWQDFADLSVELIIDRDGTFGWRIEESVAASGIPSIAEATAELEEALLVIRDAIPSRRWNDKALGS